MASPFLPVRLKDFLRELKRRKVYRVGAMYVVVGLAVAQGAQWLFARADARGRPRCHGAGVAEYDA